MPEKSSSLSPAPITTQVIGQDGKVTSQWALYFQKLGVRVGGSSTSPLDQTNSSVSNVQTKVSALGGSVNALSGSVAQMEQTLTSQGDDINELIAQQQESAVSIQTLQALVSTIQNALQLDSGTWEPEFTGLTITGTVAFDASWSAIVDQVFWQVIIDATGGEASFASAHLTNLPVSSTKEGSLSAVNISALQDYGNGYVMEDGVYVPDFTITGQRAVIAGRYIRDRVES